MGGSSRNLPQKHTLVQPDNYHQTCYTKDYSVHPGKLRSVFRKSTKEDVVPTPCEFTSYQKVGKPWLFSLQRGGWNMLPRYQKKCFIRNQKGPIINPPEFHKSMTGVPAHIVAVEKKLGLI